MRPNLSRDARQQQESESRRPGRRRVISSFETITPLKPLAMKLIRLVHHIELVKTGSSLNVADHSRRGVINELTCLCIRNATSNRTDARRACNRGRRTRTTRTLDCNRALLDADHNRFRLSGATARRGRGGGKSRRAVAQCATEILLRWRRPDAPPTRFLVLIGSRGMSDHHCRRGCPRVTPSRSSLDRSAG